MKENVIFSGCGHELERVIADMACPVCMKKEIERLRHEIDVQCSSEYVERILKENEHLRNALERIDIETSDDYAREIAREARKNEGKRVANKKNKQLLDALKRIENSGIDVVCNEGREIVAIAREARKNG